MQDWKEIVKNDERYKDFVVLDTPVLFREMFADQNIPRVQLHSIQMYETPKTKGIVGFCGVFRWEKNTIIPLDGDSYSEDTMVYGYEWFTHEGDKCLDILVGNEW